jgi:hypothetical protein
VERRTLGYTAAGPAGPAADEVETETGGEGTAAIEPAQGREAKREPAPAAEPARYTPYSASTGDWQAQLPSGNGWGAPSETQLAGGRGLRITVRGPAGAALVIDYTPSQPPRFGSTD